jgi:hypothetical protein
MEPCVQLSTPFKGHTLASASSSASTQNFWPAAPQRPPRHPTLLLLQFCNRNGTPQQFASGERPIWGVSPSYYHYLGCQCATGFTARRELAWHGDVMVSGQPADCCGEQLECA